MPRYTNLDGSTPDKSFAELLRWQWGARVRGEAREDPPGFATPRREASGAALAAPGAHLTWIGHATFVLRLGGKLVATDPIWSDRIHTIKRRAAPGVPLEAVPPLDVVAVSHAHYDHLDLPTLRRLGPAPLYVVPKDVGPVLRRAGLPRVVELGWFESHTEGALTITCVPAQHWSMRLPWDRNRRLWGGFVLTGPEGTVYHAGDTARSDAVAEAIASRCPPIDWALLPIGAYDPPWFMQSQHMGPEDALAVFHGLRARTLVAMHWGTFKLTNEPLGEPPARLRRAFAEAGEDPSRLWILDLGETRPLAP